MAGVMELVSVARAGIENLNPAEVAAELEAGDVLLVDVREPDEIAGGVIGGAVLAPRGMLELHADPGSAHHLPGFEPERRVILYCATGLRSALAARSLQDLGYREVAHLDGGYRAWLNAGRGIVLPST